MNVKIAAILGLTVLLSGVPTWASLDTVTLSSAGYGATGTAKIYGGGHDGVTTTAGLLKYEVTASSGAGDDLFDVGSTIGVFCMDLGQYASSYKTYDITDPADGPVPDTYLGSGMGVEKAALLSELWGRYYDSSWLTGSTYTEAQKNAAEAFQICIWEIIYEDYGNAVDITSDGTSGELGFKAKYVESSLANSWLTSLDGTGPTADLVSLSNCYSQDFLTAVNVEVPEPATVALLGFGMMIVTRATRK